MRIVTAVSATVAVLALPAAASAQEPAAPAQPAPLTLRLAVDGSAPTPMVVKGSKVRLRVVQSVFTPNTRVKVRVYRGTKKVDVVGANLQPTKGGKGRALMSYRPGRTGHVTLRAAAGPVQSEARDLDILPRRVGSRSGKGSVRILQRKLAALGYVTGSPGAWDARTARAVLAFRKVTGMDRTSEANINVMRRLARGGGTFRVRRAELGRHVEIDLSRQVMAFVSASGRVERIYAVSSGAPATPTIRGTFSVYRKDYGTNALGMIDAAYFIGGYAIHGFRSVPTYPASHGCLRVAPAEARSISNWVKRGTKVTVYP